MAMRGSQCAVVTWIAAITFGGGGTGCEPRRPANATSSTVAQTSPQPAATPTVAPVPTPAPPRSEPPAALGVPWAFPELPFPIPAPSAWPVPQGGWTLPTSLPSWPFPVPSTGPTPPAAPTPTPTPTPAPTSTPAPTPTPPTVAVPSSEDAPTAFEAEVLVRVNAQRAAGGRCGTQSFPPSGPLTEETILRRAARAHGRDMAGRDYFDHTTPDGRSPSDRAAAAGWPRSGMLGENIAAGQTSPEAVVNGWISSPGHCANILNPRYRRLGVGYQQVPSSRYFHYWVQLFAD